MPRVTDFVTEDIRFPTSLNRHGSDAMNADPDYSAAYVVIRTDSDDGCEGHASAFTIGRGTEVVIAAIEAVRVHLVGRDVDSLLRRMGETSRELLGDSQLRWLGPEKGAMHMAIGAVVNALWDLKAKRAGLPLWRLLSDMSPDDLVELVDFRYLSDAITPSEAHAIFSAAAPTRAERVSELVATGYPAYTTTPGWLGYDDATLERLCRAAVQDGFRQVKLKVGRNLSDDVRRLSIARAAVGPNVAIAVDANQCWDVPAAIEWLSHLDAFDLSWVEEPTSPDDVLGHARIARAIAPVPVATGEHAANRVIFKQLLQAHAVGIVQIDAARVAGVNENVAVLLLAEKFGVPVCPHAGGVGLCELVQHLSFFDYVAVSGKSDGRMIEYVDHLHEHFADPVEVHHGRFWPSGRPGGSGEMLPDSRTDYAFRAVQTPSPAAAAAVAGVGM